MQERGFSLIELLIVIAIILVISAVAIPNFLRSRIAANEASAVYSIRAINTAQVTYATNYPQVGYASTLTALGPSSAGVLDLILGCTTATCQKSGYEFQIANPAGNPVSSYAVYGTPVSPGISGSRGFCSSDMNPVMVDPNGSNNCTQPLE